ncbi:MAG: hypothetical protein M0Q92_08055 [Methanoregula sp.]|jgi:ABC-type transport system substrate-binding protein|nr:hypothetical protein [Methanoregula sp.]
MKTALTLLVIVLAVLACGCTATAPQTTTAATATPAVSAPAIPDLVGTWTGPMTGYDEGIGFSDYPGMTIKFIVTEQKDRIFTGTIEFTNPDGSMSLTGFAGAISPDGKTLTITEKNSGYTTGRVISEDEIELTYLHDASPFSASIDTLKRV